jgi:hypothetical protein
MEFRDIEKSVYCWKSPLRIIVTALENRIPYRAISGTRQRLWMLAGKGRFQLTGVLMDVEPVFSGPQ